MAVEATLSDDLTSGSTERPSRRRATACVCEGVSVVVLLPTLMQVAATFCGYELKTTYVLCNLRTLLGFLHGLPLLDPLWSSSDHILQ